MAKNKRKRTAAAAAAAAPKLGSSASERALDIREILERVLSFLPTPADVARCAPVSKARRGIHIPHSSTFHLDLSTFCGVVLCVSRVSWMVLDGFQLGYIDCVTQLHSSKRGLG